MYEEIRYGRLYEQIVSQIEERILNGTLNPGDRLPPERELARQFNVSRTAVREAMKALVHKGLIVVQPGRGTFVTDSTSVAARNSIDLLLKYGNYHNTLDLVEIREILEPEIAALAATRATPEHIEQMEAAVQAMDAAMSDPDAYIEADLDFHLALAQATQNALFPLLIDALVDLLRDHRKRAASVPGALERGQPFHKDILSAVNSDDPENARRIMRAHLNQIRIDVVASLSIGENQ